MPCVQTSVLELDQVVSALRCSLPSRGLRRVTRLRPDLGPGHTALGLPAGHPASVPALGEAAAPGCEQGRGAQSCSSLGSRRPRARSSAFKRSGRRTRCSRTTPGARSTTGSWRRAPRARCTTVGPQAHQVLVPSAASRTRLRRARVRVGDGQEARRVRQEHEDRAESLKRSW